MASPRKPSYHGPPPGPDPLGAASAKDPDAPPQYQTPFAAITLNLTDRIRLVGFPAPDVAAAQDFVAAAWAQGIQNVKQLDRTTEIKLRGNPWFDRYSGDDDSARSLMRTVLSGLFERGWVVQAPVDLSKREGEKDTLLFRFQSPPPPPSDWLTVSVAHSDRLRFLDAPPQPLRDAIVAAYGAQVKGHGVEDGSWEVKFKGPSRGWSGTEAIGTAVQVLELLGTLEGFGWGLYGGVDRADALYFRKRRDWSPGESVYHR